MKETEAEGRTSRTPSESSDKDSRDGRYRECQKFAQVRPGTCTQLAVSVCLLLFAYEVVILYAFVVCILLFHKVQWVLKKNFFFFLNLCVLIEGSMLSS